jgi:hypothetical protein
MGGESTSILRFLFAIEYSVPHRQFSCTPQSTGNSLPLFHVSRNDSEQGMCRDSFDRPQARPRESVAANELGLQKLAFVSQLSAQHWNARTPPTAANFRSIEAVSATHTFTMHFMEVCRNGSYRIAAGSEPRELRMMAVSLGEAAQHLLRQEALPP